MKKNTLIGIIAGVVIVPVVACAILLNYKGSGVSDVAVNRDLAEIESETTSFLDENAIALASSSQVDANLQNMAREAVSMINAQRASANLPELALSVNLENVAIVRASEISSVFSHTRPDGSPWNTVNSRIQGGENLAYGFSSASSAVNAWMNSPSHRENILWPSFTKVGISIYVTDNGTYYWAQEFGY